MSHLVADTQGESDGLWLPLTEYSVRSGVSLSTIRRKIKSNSIPYKLEKGKYLILFGGVEKAPVAEVSPSPAIAVTNPQAKHWDGLVEPSPSPVRRDPPRQPIAAREDESLRLLTDAFEHALREKDEHIRLLENRNQELEERLSELKLLIQVLEEKFDVRY